MVARHSSGRGWVGIDWEQPTTAARRKISAISESQLDAEFLCRFDWTVWAVLFKLGEGDNLLNGRRPMERNQVRLALFVVNPHDEEHPTSINSLNTFTSPRDIHGSPWAKSYVKCFTLCCAIADTIVLKSARGATVTTHSPANSKVVQTRFTKFQ